MTISPPAKVKNRVFEPYEIMASGFDSLYLNLKVRWSDSSLFERLEELKGRAQEERMDVAGFIDIEGQDQPWVFMMKPFGANGYEWLLNNREMTLKILNNLKPGSRPSVCAEIRSETLWSDGPEKTISKLIDLLMSQGGRSITVEPSRVDICVDFLMPEDEWALDLTERIITRADRIDPHISRKYGFTGLSIGRGKLLARLYNKPLEIKINGNKKLWMYDVWKTPVVPEGFKIIRTEFQFRREALVTLNIKKMDDLFGHCDNLWGYASQKWLKFQTPGKHHTQRKNLPFWTAIQNGFLGSQSPTPAVRATALKATKEQLQKQLYGLATSLVAVQLEEDDFDIYELPSLFNTVRKAIDHSDHSDSEFREDIIKKRVMAHRKQDKWDEAEKLRSALHLPSSVTRSPEEPEII